MFVNKIGAQHLAFGRNCQDYGLEKETVKLVCDGCSEGAHSEVGVKMYCHLSELGYSTKQIFKRLTGIFGQSSASIRDYLCFTILKVIETENFFKVSYCGDGYLILEDLEGGISFEELSDGEYPKYFAYNYCDAKMLTYYKDGVRFTEQNFSKRTYKNVGIASDGLRFIVKSENETLKAELIGLLKAGRAVGVKRFINRNQKLFQDDITIVF
ncbi:MAG: hypothetical protein K2N44_13900 [Lachnospiraceae bacterium]|nr:hypothetical protein [Lachnospiraceae bacterium]